MTTSLKKLQTRFAEAVLDKNLTPELMAEIKVPARVAHPARILDVHREGYFLRLIEALGETYDATWWLLGDKDFFEHARAYVNHNKSSYYNLSDYGQSFPYYLAETLESKKFYFLTDLARLEWEFKEIFHTAQHTTLDPEVLQSKLAGENITLHLGAVRTMRSAHKVIEIWRNRNKPYDQVSFDTEGNEIILLFKQEGKIFMQDIPEARFNIIESLTTPQELESALEQHPDLKPEEVAETFAFLMQEGLITEVTS
ncbi:MAG: putative DNA-binding domain-containing protein [Oligoflexales bacterium]